MKPCKICHLETDCIHRSRTLSEVVEDYDKEAFNAGLRRAMKIAEDFESGGDDGCRCASMIMQAIEQEIK